MARFRRLFERAPVIIIVILAAVLLAEVGSIAAQRAGWTPHDLAYYLDQNLVNFVRPGLVVKITGATIQDSKITVTFKLTDPRGLPLDREGVFTPGTVSTSFIAAYIPKSDKVYTAYTTRLQTSPITNKSAVQAGTDSGGTYAKVADGEYTYTFRTTVPATYDPTLTHSIGMYSSRGRPRRTRLRIATRNAVRTSRASTRSASTWGCTASMSLALVISKIGSARV